MSDPNLPSNTPNVVIEDPAKRKKLNTTLSILLLVVGLGSLFFAAFPELAFGTDIPARVTSFLTAAVTLISGWFGLGVINRNIPKS